MDITLTAVICGVLAWLGQHLRAFVWFPSWAVTVVLALAGVSAYALLIHTGAWDRGAFTAAIMWMAALPGIARILADSKAAPATDSKP